MRSYSGMMKFDTFEDRYEYLKLDGPKGVETFGFDRYLNQRFYRSAEWKRIRNHIIARDLGMDLGIDGREIFTKPLVHHINPLGPNDVIYGTDYLLDPENLVTVSHNTHNAIHFGNKHLLQKDYEPRTPGDTVLWDPINLEEIGLR